MVWFDVVWAWLTGKKEQDALTFEEFLALVGVTGEKPSANAGSVFRALVIGGEAAGLDKPHRLAMYLAQLSHESAGFVHDKEIWGPTPAQKRYDTRTDLGNTAAADGDGFLFRGRGPIQITGKSNYRQFTDWCLYLFKDDIHVPNFVVAPDLVNTDPWEGLVPLWYWTTRKLNKAADAGDFRRVTHLINGGYNGQKDRERRYTQIALRLLGFPSTREGILDFQRKAGLVVDGISGPATQTALWKELTLLKALNFAS